MRKGSLRVFCAIVGAAVGLGGSGSAIAEDPGVVEATDRGAQIPDAPHVERTTDSWAIIRWSTPKVGGTSLRYGVVHYGAAPGALVETAKSPNRSNPASLSMIFRVQINHLQPQTTYYYRVESVDAFNIAEVQECELRQFTTAPPPGELSLIEGTLR